MDIFYISENLITSSKITFKIAFSVEQIIINGPRLFEIFNQLLPQLWLIRRISRRWKNRSFSTRWNGNIELDRYDLRDQEIQAKTSHAAPINHVDLSSARGDKFLRICGNIPCIMHVYSLSSSREFVWREARGRGNLKHIVRLKVLNIFFIYRNK